MKNLAKTYVSGEIKTHALVKADLEIKKGEFVGIFGPSGSGKSTLLHLMGLLDQPSKGKITLHDTDISQLNETQKTKLRLTSIGYVFQQYRLLPELTALENVYLPALMNGDDEKQKAKKLLTKVGLSHRLNHFYSELSGGEQQRVAIARSLINTPDIILADEPTANLDSNNGDQIMQLFKDLNKTNQQTIVVVSHEPEHKKYFDRVINLKDGIVL